MSGIMRRLLAFVAMVLFTVACGAKKLWGVDVVNNEDKGEFESLLAKASGASSGGQNDFMETLAGLAGADLSKFTLSDMSTRMIDALIEVIQDEEWVAQFSEPGMIRRIVQNSGVDALLADESMASPERDDWLELMALEESPILYKTKFLELREKAVGKLVMLRLTFADPEKLNVMIRDLLKSMGLDDGTIKELLEIANNPQLLSNQIEEILSDPGTIQELTSLVNMLMGGDPRGGLQDLYDDEFSQLLEAMQENPEELEKLYQELLDDPTFAEEAKELRQRLMAAGGLENDATLRRDAEF